MKKDDCDDIEPWQWEQQQPQQHQYQHPIAMEVQTSGIVVWTHVDGWWFVLLTLVFDTILSRGQTFRGLTKYFILVSLFRCHRFITNSI